MKTIKELLDEVIDLEGKVQISQAIDFHKGVPTLEKGGMLKFYNADLKHVIEPGDFQIMIGTNSKDVKTMKLSVK